ncbi:MAG: heme ABC transporter permease [Alphaproteobacteria bacterium]
MFGLSNPLKFMRFSGAILPYVSAIAALVLGVGLYWGLVKAPPDYQQGETVRIMFVHVPSVWTAMFTYSFIAGASVVSLIWRHSLADVAAKAAAPIGAVFTLVALISGSIWGRPMWGTWWVWDARLTSFLVLFLMYLGYIALWQMIEEPIRAGKAAAILAIVGFINIPIIKFSVDWWNTLHQPASVMRLDGPAIHPTILIPLLIMALGFTVLFVALELAAMRAEILRRRIRAIRLAQTGLDGGGGTVVAAGQ